MYIWIKACTEGLHPMRPKERPYIKLKKKLNKYPGAASVLIRLSVSAPYFSFISDFTKSFP